MDQDLSLKPDLVRRVHNLALGPTTPSNALVPVFEAIYNSIHAIQDAYGNNWCDRGRITVAFIDFSGTTPSVEIRDNGIGLDETNFQAFRTYDSDHKARRGGKGVGRLSWLKIFERAEVSSVFRTPDNIYRKREFILTLDNLTPISSYSLVDVVGNTI